MKRNKKTYLLLLLVLVIWGVLGFKLLGSLNPNKSPSAPLVAVERFKPNAITKKDTFSIIADYRDPFLGTLPKRKDTVSRKKTIPKIVTVPEKQIRYSGFVTESTTGKKIFFLSIDGQNYMMTLLQVEQEVKLLAGNGENIKVKYGSQTKLIPLTP